MSEKNSKTITTLKKCNQPRKYICWHDLTSTAIIDVLWCPLLFLFCDVGNCFQIALKWLSFPSWMPMGLLKALTLNDDGDGDDDFLSPVRLRWWWEAHSWRVPQTVSNPQVFKLWYGWWYDDGMCEVTASNVEQIYLVPMLQIYTKGITRKLVIDCMKWRVYRILRFQFLLAPSSALYVMIHHYIAVSDQFCFFTHPNATVSLHLPQCWVTHTTNKTQTMQENSISSDGLCRQQYPTTAVKTAGEINAIH